RARGRSRDRALGRGDDRDPAGERAPLADPHRRPAPTLHLPPGAAAGGEPRHDAGRPARARPGARGTHALGSSKGASATPSEPPPATPRKGCAGGSPRSKRGESDALPGLRRRAPGAGPAASASAAPATLAGRASGRWGLRGGGRRPIGVMRRLVAAPLGAAAPVVAGASVAEPAAPRLEPRASLLREPASLL